MFKRPIARMRFATPSVMFNIFPSGSGQRIFHLLIFLYLLASVLSIISRSLSKSIGWNAEIFFLLFWNQYITESNLYVEIWGCQATGQFSPPFDHWFRFLFLLSSVLGFQNHPHCRPDSSFTFDFQPAVKFFYDSMGDGQPQTRAFPHLFCGEKRFQTVLLFLLCALFAPFVPFVVKKVRCRADFRPPLKAL